MFLWCFCLLMLFLFGLVSGSWREVWDGVTEDGLGLFGLARLFYLFQRFATGFFGRSFSFLALLLVKGLELILLKMQGWMPI